MLAHWLHGKSWPAGYAHRVLSGSPVIYPPLGAVADSLGRLGGARILSVAFMVGATILLYLTASSLLGRTEAIIATALWGATEPVYRLTFATYDPMSVFLVALSAWLAVEAGWRRRRGPLVASAAALALANATAYPSLVIDPVVIAFAFFALLPLDRCPPRGLLGGVVYCGMAGTLQPPDHAVGHLGWNRVHGPESQSQRLPATPAHPGRHREVLGVHHRDRSDGSRHREESRASLHKWPNATSFVAAFRPAVARTNGLIFASSQKRVAQYYAEQGSKWWLWQARDLLLNPERVPRSDWRPYYATHVAAGRYDLIALFYAAPRSGPGLSAATAPGSLGRAVLLRVAQPEELEPCRARRASAHASARPRPVIPPGSRGSLPRLRRQRHLRDLAAYPGWLTAASPDWLTAASPSGAAADRRSGHRRGRPTLRAVTSERAAQAFPPSVQPGHYGSDRGAHDPGDLPVRVSLDIG